MIQPYERQSFFGREEIVDKIIKQLLDADADKKRQRSLVIESPSGRGKTWLLSHIAQQISDPDGSYAKAGVVALYLVKEDFAQLSNDDSRWHPSITAICAGLRRHPLLHSILAWPLELFAPTEETLLDRLRPEVQSYLATVAGILQLYPAANILPELVKQIEAANICCVLIVDGLEETSEELLKEFEIKVLVPLFRSERVRLLSSRRVESQTHRWKMYTIRQQTHPPEQLMPLDSEHPQAPIKPYEQQIKHLIREQLKLSILKAQPTLEQDVQAIYNLLIKQAGEYYSWGNPGANYVLVDKALAHQPQGTITIKDVEAVLRDRLNAPRADIELPQGTSGEDEIFEWLDAMVTHFTYQIKSVGVPQRDISSAMGWSDSETNKRLGYLQSIGVGITDLNKLFRIYPEFVELFMWLH